MTTSRRWPTLAMVSLGVFIISLENSIVNVALVSGLTAASPAGSAVPVPEAAS